MMHISDNEEALLDYLYDEGDPSERLKIARHLQGCATCSVAVLEFQAVRGLLSEWTPPAARLGFKIVPDRADSAGGDGRPAASSRSWWRSRPGADRPNWAQAAVGIVLFAAGMGFSQLRVEYGDGRLTVRARSVAPGAAASVQPRGPLGDVTLTAMPIGASEPSAASPNLAALEQTLRAELAAHSTSRSASADEVLNRVKALIDQSESRQQRELALRVAQVVNDFDTQRRADLLRVEQNFGQLEGQTGAEVAQQRELLNSLVKVSQGGGR